ncbi:MAG TPA: hypothetical protein DEB25_08750 [Desulfobulbaceae bacterium]|nr:hypothetical protein [Desulfobulbaceae bacterium]
MRIPVFTFSLLLRKVMDESSNASMLTPYALKYQHLNNKGSWCGELTAKGQYRLGETNKKIIKNNMLS